MLYDANFPYPIAYENAYNMAMQLSDLLQKNLNLLWAIIFILVLVIVTRICFRLMQ